MDCPSCGHANPPGAVFCQHCDGYVGSPSAPSAAPAPTTAAAPTPIVPPGAAAPTAVPPGGPSRSPQVPLPPVTSSPTQPGDLPSAPSWFGARGTRPGAPAPGAMAPAPPPEPAPTPAATTTPAATNPPAVTPAPAAPGSSAAPPDTGRDTQSLASRLTPGMASVVPGASAEFELTVTNTGDIVEQYALVARGIPPQWVQASPRMAQVYIGEKVTFRITVSPPMAPTTAPGRMDFAIEVMSTIDNRVAERHDGFLDVQPFTSVTTSLEPPDLDAKRSARTYLNVVNAGNATEHVAATVRDTANKLRFSCRPSTVEVPPGGRARVAIDVRAARRRWTGTERRLQFNVTTASPPRDTDLRLQGSFTVLPSWPRWALPAMVGGFAILLVAATVLGMRLLQQRDAAATRTVPTLTDLDYQTASQQLLALQLEGLIVEARTDPKPFGRILLQTPGPGTKVAAKSTVNLVVSTGPDQWILSDLRKQDYVTASAELTQRGMRIQAVSQPDKAATPGTIIEQNPPPGTKLNIGDVVTLTVAKADKSATVPNIPIGTARDEAVRLIQEAGLQASVKPPVASPDFAPGQVMEISPAPGQPTTQGSIVTLTVSKGLVVPSVVGQTRDAALQQISQAGLSGKANDRCSTESPGIVLEQTPAANTAVDKSARVTLSISKACPPGG